MPQSRQLSETVEEYLQAIYYLSRDGRAVIAARVADWLGVAPPSVTSMLQRMARDGLLEQDVRRGIRLTELGQAEARSIARRHYIAERLLTDLLGLSWSDAHAEADRWEHAISGATERRLLEVLGHPQTCPHGSPIPGTGGRVSPNAFGLPEAQVDETVVVSHVAEAAEENVELLALLERHGVMPGARVTVRARPRGSGTLTVEAPNGPAELPTDLAAQVYVLPERLAAEAPRRPRPILRRFDRLAPVARRAAARTPSPSRKHVG